jgi:hypothetical protein
MGADPPPSNLCLRRNGEMGCGRYSAMLEMRTLSNWSSDPIPRSAIIALGNRPADVIQTQVNLASAKDNTSTRPADRVVNGELDSNMVLYARKLWPGSALSSEHALKHILCRWVAQDFGEVGVRNGREYRDIARIALVQNGSRLSDCVRKDAHIREHLQSVERFAFCQIGHAVDPAWSSLDSGTVLCFGTNVFLFFCKEWYDMRIDLGNNEMINVEHLAETSHGKVVVDGSINETSIRRRIPWHFFSSSGVFG